MSIFLVQTPCESKSLFILLVHYDAVGRMSPLIIDDVSFVLITTRNWWSQQRWWDRRWRLQQGIDDHNKDDAIDDDDDQPDLFHGLEVWAESTVAAEDLLVNNRSNRQAAKIF